MDNFTKLRYIVGGILAVPGFGMLIMFVEGGFTDFDLLGYAALFIILGGLLAFGKDLVDTIFSIIATFR